VTLKLAVMVDVIGIDHLYISVSDMNVSERFYDRVMIETLGFRKNQFELGGDPHIQYFNRHFGFVLRPSRAAAKVDPYATGLHHFCLRVDSIADVHIVAAKLRALGVDASEPRLYPDYATDYCATFFEDPDGIRLEVTNYRQERRERHDRWDRVAT
jgi:glyoxylase I family protein